MPHVPGPFSVDRSQPQGLWLLVAIVVALAGCSLIGLTAIAAWCLS